MKNKKKVLLLAGIMVVAVVSVLGYQMYEVSQRKLAEEAQRIEAEEKEKAEAQKAAEAEEKRLEEIKAHLAAEEAQKAKEKAAEEAKQKEAEAKETAEQPAAEQEAEKEEIIVTQPQAVAALTMTGSKNEVTEKAKVIEPKQPENKVEPKPAVAAPTEDIKEHSEAERKAEEAAKTDPAAPPVNQSGNGIAASDSPDNPFNHLNLVPEVYDETTMTDGSKYSTHEPGTGDKF